MGGWEETRGEGGGEGRGGRWGDATEEDLKNTTVAGNKSSDTRETRRQTQYTYHN